MLVSDAGSCTVKDTFVITELRYIKHYLFSIQNVKCYNGNDGSIYLEYHRGTSPYTYLWNTSSNSEDLKLMNRRNILCDCYRQQFMYCP
ncbi:MAG: SprB repeat-containing protein [Bacteroidia bacterium]